MTATASNVGLPYLLIALVRPEAFPEREQPIGRRAQLSRASAALLRDVAESTEDPALKAALLRLSRRGLFKR